MKLIDSQALGVVNKALGLTGSGAQITELNDGVVDQTLELGQLVRRGRTLAGTEGVFVFVMQNIHTIANSLTSILDPYVVGAGLRFPPFPSPVPPQFDLWLLGATIFQVSGAGTISAALGLNFPASSIGASVTNTGGHPAAGVTTHMIAFWDALTTENVEFALLSGDRGPFARIGLRLPRGTSSQIIFASTSSAAAVFNCHVLMGLFPVALGQDAIV